MESTGRGRKNVQLVILLALQGMLALEKRKFMAGPNEVILTREIA